MGWPEAGIERLRPGLQRNAQDSLLLLARDPRKPRR